MTKLHVPEAVLTSPHFQVFEATNAIRDVLIEKCDPILGLSTVHRSLEGFLKRPAPEESLVDARTSSYCFSLVALAKFILLLPAEVLEDELPRLKNTLITVRAAAHPSPAGS